MWRWMGAEMPLELISAARLKGRGKAKPQGPSHEGGKPTGPLSLSREKLLPLGGRLA